jgi:hypothetical protein
VKAERRGALHLPRMATIHREIPLPAAPHVVWDAVRDVGNVHRRLVPGVLVDARLDGDARVVTFASGAVVRELIVTVDDGARRLVWSARGTLAHHSAAMQVADDGAGGSRLLWTTDILPDDAAERIAALVDAGAAAVRRTFGG